jgi:hypothetical protein
MLSSRKNYCEIQTTGAILNLVSYSRFQCKMYEKLNVKHKITLNFRVFYG